MRVREALEVAEDEENKDNDNDENENELNQ